jgi:hypothetical protein
VKKSVVKKDDTYQVLENGSATSVHFESSITCCNCMENATASVEKSFAMKTIVVVHSITDNAHETVMIHLAGQRRSNEY